MIAADREREWVEIYGDNVAVRLRLVSLTLVSIVPLVRNCQGWVCSAKVRMLI